MAMALVVLGWWAGLGKMVVLVSIAVRSGLSCRREAVGAGTAGSAPVRNSGFLLS